MERKLKTRFVLVSMASLLAVLFLLFSGINIFNYAVNTNALDRTLHMIAEKGDMTPPDVPHGPPFGGPASPESRAMTRFFAVMIDESGNITSTGLDFISSISEDDAEAYARAVDKKSRSSGYYGEYRYLICESENGATMVFLNSASQLQQMRTLLLLSLVLSVLCFLVMLALVTLLSKRAVAPYVRNMEIQKRFITDASHELKTPLTAISASADVLALDDGENEWVKNIACQAQRLTRLVGDLVMMSRLDEERPIPDMSEFSLSEALWESAEPFSAAAKATGRNFEANIEDNMTLCGDVVSIQQLTSILLDNAVKYTNENGFIRLSAYRKKQKSIIEVFNTCDGLDPENLDRLFDRFYRGDRSRSDKISGTGVGLSIAKAIAKAHGGDITARSQNGSSITFTVVL